MRLIELRDFRINNILQHASRKGACYFKTQKDQLKETTSFVCVKHSEIVELTKCDDATHGTVVGLKL